MEVTGERVKDTSGGKALLWTGDKMCQKRHEKQFKCSMQILDGTRGLPGESQCAGSVKTEENPCYKDRWTARKPCQRGNLVLRGQ